MKQAKKMLCMLLVMLLAFSTVSIGVNAAYTSYASPSSYDMHEKPLFTTAQRGSQLLDYVDAMLYDMRDDLYIDITIMKLDFTSVDKALDTIDGLESAANLIGGDVGDLNIDALGSTRRGTAGKTDLNILYELLYFLNANRGIVGKFLKGQLDLGLIKSFVDLDFNVYELLIDMLYEMAVDESYNPDNGRTNWTADQILQHAVDVILLGGTAADGDIEEGFLPSMAGKTNINTQTIWQIIENAANAATKDILVPLIENELKPNMEKWKVEMPSDAWNLIDVSKLDISGYTWAQYDPTNGVVAELNHFIYYVLEQIWVGEKFWVDGGNDKLQQNLEAALEIAYEELGDVLLPASSEFITVDEFKALDLQQTVVYVAKQFLQAEMPYIVWEDSWGTPVPLENIGQLACYVAYSIIADLNINTDYMTNVEWGMAEYGKDLALEMVADIGAYYLNGALPVSIGYGEGVEMLLKKLVDWALSDNQFGGFFKGCGVSASDSPWKKIDKTVLAAVPLHQIFGGNITGSEDFVMNRLLGSIFDLDFENLLEILYKSSSSALNKTVPQFVVWLANGLLNVIVTRNTQPALISTSLTSVDAIIQNNNLAGTAERLLNGLYNAGQHQYFWDSLLPILNPILIDESGYSFNVIAPPAGYGVNSLETLQAHVEAAEAVISQPDDVYETDASKWNESEDYELWRYDQLEDAIDYAWDVINGYPGAVTWVEEANAQLAEANASGDANAITDAQNNLAEAQANLASYNAAKYANAAYEIDYYMNKAAADQNIAAKVHLQYIIYTAEAKEMDGIYVENLPTEEVWNNYVKARDHAYALLAIEGENADGSASSALKQSMLNEARKNLMDAMRLLAVELADVTALLDMITVAENTSTEGKTAESIAHLNEVIAAAKELAGTLLTIDRQDDVDGMIEDLQAAIDALADFVETIVPTLDKIKEDVKTVGGFIYNLATQLTPDALLADYVNSDENGTLEVVTAVDGVVGTGSVLKLKDNDGNVVEEHTVVIFGDANGDGIVDVMDTIYLDLHQAGEITLAGNSAQWYALNLNADGFVDATDVVALDGYANFERTIDQGAIYA